MNRLITIGQAANILGVSISTLRRWELDGKISPERTNGLHRRYDLAKLKPESMVLSQKSS
jgi:excisionase family DNA binding protein